jgi:hypothetical protein
MESRAYISESVGKVITGIIHHTDLTLHGLFEELLLMQLISKKESQQFI